MWSFSAQVAPFSLPLSLIADLSGQVGRGCAQGARLFAHSFAMVETPSMRTTINPDLDEGFNDLLSPPNLQKVEESA